MDIQPIDVGPDDWGPALDELAGPQVVVGGPGTGKTEFLACRVARLLAHGVPAGDILVVGFDREGGRDIAERIRERAPDQSARVDTHTFHSLAMRVVRLNWAKLGWASPPEVLTGPEQVDLVRRLLARSDPAAFSPAFRGILDTATFAGEVSEFILMAHEQGHDGPALRRRCEGRADWRGLATFLDAYHLELRHRSRIDYGTLIAEACRALEGAATVHVGSSRPYVLIDEYHEATPAQARLAGLAAGAWGNLTVAADRDQMIYGFRGAAPGNLHNLTPFRAGRGLEPLRSFRLTTSFRVPLPILATAESLFERTGVSAERTTPAGHNARVETHRFEHFAEEADWIATEIHRTHVEDAVPFEAIGVFTRTADRLLPVISAALDRRGIPNRFESTHPNDGSAARFVADLVTATTAPSTREDLDRAVRNVLLGPLFAAGPDDIRAIEHSRSHMPDEPWSGVLRKIAQRYEGLADVLEDASWAVEMSAPAGLWHLWEEVAGDLLVGVPGRSTELADWTALSRRVERWAERHPGRTLRDHMEAVEAEAFPERPPVPRHGNGVTLTTLHRVKGTNLEVVFIADAVEGVLPDLRPRDSLLGIRHLLDHLPVDTQAYRRFRLDQERRLGYTAMVRARTRVTWTASRVGPGSQIQSPSRFLLAIAGGDQDARRPAERPLVLTARDAQGALRRMVQDPARAESDRLAAMTVLAERPRSILSDPARLADDHPGIATPLHDPPRHLTPSDAESYLSCPRRFVLDRRLEIGTGPSVHAAFGSLIHAVLEETESAALSRSLPHGSAQDAMSSFQSLFDPDRFGGPPFSESWRRRGLEDLEGLYESWPSTADVAATEAPVDLELGGVRWRGRIDRLEREGETIRIVDYKTGRSPITVADGAASIQLGFYHLAAATAFAAPGDRIESEMWFISARSRRIPVRRFDPENLGTVEAGLAHAASGITAGDWSPRPGPQCDRCPQRDLCPAVTDMDHSFR